MKKHCPVALAVLALAGLVTLVSCGSSKTTVKTGGKTTTAAKKEAPGTSRDSAVLLSPTTSVRQSDTISLSETRREFWFRMNAKKGSYTFESVGAASKGYPSATLHDSNLWIISSSQGQPNKNFILKYDETNDRTDYLKVVLASGKNWKGKIKYKMAKIPEPAKDKDKNRNKKK